MHFQRKQEIFSLMGQRRPQVLWKPLPELHPACLKCMNLNPETTIDQSCFFNLDSCTSTLKVIFVVPPYKHRLYLSLKARSMASYGRSLWWTSHTQRARWGWKRKGPVEWNVICQVPPEPMHSVSSWAQHAQVPMVILFSICLIFYQVCIAWI